MKRTLHGMLALVAVFLLHVPAARAQVDRATLTGIVKDSGGARRARRHRDGHQPGDQRRRRSSRRRETGVVSVRQPDSRADTRSTSS